MCPPGQLISRARLQTRHGGCENSLELAQAAKALAQCPAADDDHDHFRIGNLPTRSLDRLSRYETIGAPEPGPFSGRAQAGRQKTDLGATPAAS